ncbi:hypothetical protein LOTGIDRAFT_102960, partial [Lottia gigantea]
LFFQLRGFDDNYLLRHKDVPSRSRRSADHHTKRLIDDSRVEWADQQYTKIRVKRDFLDDDLYDGDFTAKREAENLIYSKTSFNDPLWEKQWYLHDDREDLSESKKDLHVIPAWKKGYTGKGITVSILDDGLERLHTDLADNYSPEASYDYNGDDDDPTPRYDPTNENKHGTRCAGEVAMIANNGKCGVGIAFNAKIGGIRMLDGEVTDTLEGQALQHAIDVVDIFSASWGPNDDGNTLEGPGKLAHKAFENGVTEGRKGKGVIYVWASGNGGRLYDNCDCDGYTGSIYTLSISSASQVFKRPWYGELCASTMGTTYSSGSAIDDRISTDLNDTCTKSHTGTSAAAPLAAGIIALLLESNPDLTWRDVQHLVTWTSQAGPLIQQSKSGWTRNGAGFLVNTAFGFGILDTAGLIDAAEKKTWKSVPKQMKCTINSTSKSNLPHNQRLEIQIYSSGCEGQENEINYIEHVQLHLTLDYTKRGAISVHITSPSNTTTMLLSERPYDKSTKGFQSWPLMSVHNWGEDPKGTWKVVLEDTTDDKNNGILQDLRLVIYGTTEQPHHMRHGPRKYIGNYNHVQNKEQVGISQKKLPKQQRQFSFIDINSQKSDPNNKTVFVCRLGLHYQQGTTRCKYGINFMV